MALDPIRHALFATVAAAALACGGDDATDDTQGGTSSPTATATDPTSGSGSADSVGGSGMASASGGGTGDSGGPADATDDAADSSGTGGDSGWEACGLTPPTGPGDSVEPQHPDSPEIVAACTGLCAAWAGIADCPAEMISCIDACSLRTCQICPGTLAPLVECETTNFDETACVCGESGPTCPIPEACAEQEQQTGFCGG